MAFERDRPSYSGPKRRVAAGALLLAAGALGAGMTIAGTPEAGATAAAALAVLMGCVFMRRGLAELAPASQALPIEVPVGMPRDRAELAAKLLALEARLEHAPAALFLLSARSSAGGAAISPMNINARRLLAPGRAVDANGLFARLDALVPGQRHVIDFDTERGRERAIGLASEMTVEGVPQRIAMLIPVESELEAEAMQAWQRLVHVLTHEIMNSLTPVASLSQTSRDLLADVRAALPAGTEQDLAQDVDVALDAIGRRAGSLAHFVGNYRSLASVPAAQPQAVAVAAVFARLSALVSPGWQARGGRADFSVEPASLELMIDPGQFEQALINLLKNAEEATAATAGPELAVSARLIRGGRLRIEIRDNGPGVDDEWISHIFTPFFSTKNKGSGIGLAMVRQLVHRNGGTVRYAKQVGAGACFVMTF
ncbi:MAG TPA: sensor histidine kinase [Paucimonas sp.]|nr:sensor histidine kinase [Paucimonas sp.]